jgi:hypothetical protein
MAVRWAIANGNWSNSAIWNGGLGLPTAADDVAANGFTVIIDQNITVLSLRTLTTGSAASGGGFVINDNYTINADVNSGTTNCLTFNSGSNGFTLNGNLDTINNTANIVTLTVNGTGPININGDIKRTTGGSGRSLLTVNSSPTITITGNVTPTGAATTQETIVLNAAGVTLNINGPVSVAAVNNVPIIRVNNITCNININGNISTNFTTNPVITTPGAGSIITVTGSITTNGTTGGQLVSTANIIQVYVSGSLTAGTTNTISLTGNSILQVIGPISSSISAVGVSSTGTGATNVFTGPFYNTNNRNAIYAVNLQLISGSTPTWTFDTETALEQRTLYTQNYPGNFPATTNVRQGVVFGDTGQFTGVVAVPSASNVLKGVPVGNTTGSASFDTQSVWSVATGSLTATGSIGERLKNASTVATDASLITSKGNL